MARLMPFNSGRCSSILQRIGLVSLLMGVLATARPAAAQQPAEPLEPIPPEPRFGAVEAYHAPDLADVSGIGWTRILFYWSELEREGPDDWNGFHAPLERIDRELAGGREVVGLVQHTPAWATDGPAGAGVPRGLYLPIDHPDNLWAAFIRDLVSIYQGRITRWIIWNEPDIPLGTYGSLWAGTTEDYYRLVKVAYLAAHQVDPAVHIHLGGLTYWHNPDYLRQYLAVAAADPSAAAHDLYFDAVSVHIYFKPETTTGILAGLQQELAAFDQTHKPIWLVETNAPPYDDPAQRWQEPVFQITQQMQAAFLIQQMALALSMGVERVEVYKWADQPPRPPGFEPYGLLRSDNSPRPAFYAYRAVTQHFAGFQAVQRIQRDGLMQVNLGRGDHVTRVLWARSWQGLTVEVPALAPSALLVDQSGAQQPITPVDGVYRLTLGPAPACDAQTECLVGGPPLMLVEAASVDVQADWAAHAARITGLHGGESGALPGPDGAAGASPAQRGGTSPPSPLLLGVIGLGALAGAMLLRPQP